MTITIKTHSLVDIITNSSTVIFTWASGNAEAMVLELIDEVLSVAGSDKKAADLYDIEVRVIMDELEGLLEEMLEDEEDAGLMEISAKEYGEGKEYDSWSAHWEAMLQYLMDTVPQKTLMKRENYMGFPPSTEIVVTRRDGKNTKVDAILNNLFSADGGRDG